MFEADLNKPLDIEDGLYDALICIGTFTHGHVGAGCLDELFRILKPGGRFITAIRMNYWHPAGFGKKVGQLIEKGTIRTLIRKEDRNYKDSTQAESWFMVWEKL